MPSISLTLQQSGNTAVQLQHPEFPITVDRPVDRGGGGTGLMGGQYLLTGIAGCFCSTLFAAAQSREISIDGLRVEVTAQLSDELPKRFTHIDLRLEYEKCSHPEEFDKLLAIAEKGCISVNTVKNGMVFRATQAE